MKPKKLEVIVENIPPLLVERNNWIVWKWEKRKGKWTKPPYQVNGDPAKSNDPATWVSFEKALAAYRNGGSWDGIGFMLDKSGMVGFDWDDCLDDSQNIDPEVKKHIEGIDSYTEISPSGRGMKTLCGGRLPKGGHHGERIGVFDSVRYFCVTGKIVPYFSQDIEPRHAQVEALVRKLWPSDYERPKTAIKPRPIPEALADDEVIAKALASNDGAKFKALWQGDFSGYPSQSEADQALCCKLAFWTGRDPARIDALFRASGLMREKWEREGYREKTIGRAIELTAEVYEPKRRPGPPPPPPLSETDEEREAIQAELAAQSDSGERPSASFIIDRIHSQGDSKGGIREGQHGNPDSEGQQGATKRNKGQHEAAIEQIAIGLIKSGMPVTTIQKHLENLPDAKSWLEISRPIFENATRSEKGLTQALREFVGATWGNISATNALQGITKGNTPELRKQVRVILGRFVEEGVLERVPGKDGTYRKVDNECPDIEFWTAEDKPLDLWLPLGLNRLAETMPGNIIVFSGVPDAGKTAFLLNTARYNWERFKVWYFSSEMGETELKKRLKNFNDTSLDDWKEHVKFKERSGDFADVIKPGKGVVNIIDFLEIHKDFFEIGEKLAAIHCKLKGAVAVVALQKNPGADTGLGGWRGVEKPRLYVNIEKSNICTILKAKNWATTENPNGKQTRFKIYAGCNLTQVGGWHYPQK